MLRREKKTFEKETNIKLKWFENGYSSFKIEYVYFLNNIMIYYKKILVL